MISIDVNLVHADVIGDDMAARHSTLEQRLCYLGILLAVDRIVYLLWLWSWQTRLRCRMREVAVLTSDIPVDLLILKVRIISLLSPFYHKDFLMQILLRIRNCCDP